MRKGLNMTLEQARAHAARHGHALEIGGKVQTAGKSSDALAGGTERLPTPVKMTRPEREYGLILEAMKRRGDIMDYKFQGMSLTWGADPETGRILRYKCDWLVICSFEDSLNLTEVACRVTNSRDIIRQWLKQLPVKLIEVKGSGRYAIQPAALLRFKGCRAEWPMFQFEMHQLSQGTWRRVQ